MICGGSYVRDIFGYLPIWPFLSIRRQRSGVQSLFPIPFPSPPPPKPSSSPSPPMAAAAATSFATLVSRGAPSSASSLSTIFQPFNHLTDPLVLLAGRRALGGAAVPPRLQGRPLAAPLPPQRRPPLAGRLLLRGPRGVALPQPSALRNIRQRRAQGTIFKLLCSFSLSHSLSLSLSLSLL